MLCFSLCGTFLLPASAATYTNTILPGMNLIANQLDHGSNRLADVLPSVPDGSKVFKWDETTQGFHVDTYDPIDGWMDGSSGTPSTTSLAAREAAFLLNPNPTAYELVFTGTLPSPTPPPVLSRQRYHYLSGPLPNRASYTDMTGLPPEEGVLLLRWNADAQTYQTNRFTGGTWQPSEPMAEPGEGVVVLLPPNSITNTLVINEWLASNESGIVDPADGQHDDWFEIYNPGPDAANLAGYYFTDSLTNKYKFLIPNNYVVPPRGFLLVWADNQPYQNTTNSPDLHVNFTLDGGDGQEDEEVSGGGGGEIGLFAPDGTAVDIISYGRQQPDVSEGRWPDGGTNRYLMTLPTPRAANTLTPIITQQPHGFVVETNGSADFSVQAFGTPPFGYQWYFWAREATDFRALPGQTNQTLALTQVQPSDYGSYLVAISNVAGSARSSVADLSQTANTCMFINNSFEADSWNPWSLDPPVLGWNYQANNGYGAGVQSGGGIIAGNLVVLGNAPDGKQFFNLDGGDCARTIGGHPDCGHASIDQTVNGFTIGNQYKLSFWIASEHLLPCALNLTLTGGNPLGTTTFSAPPRLAVDWDNWVQRTLNFTATASAVNFKFQHAGITPTLNYIGIGLDKLCVEPACTDTLLIACPPSQTIACQTSGAGVVVYYLMPIVTSGCGATITSLTCAPPSGSAFSPGTTTVTCTAQNNLGNTASCSFTVTVIPDTTPPVIDCSCLISHAHGLLLTNACQAAVPNLCQFAACFSDNCCLGSCSQSPAAATLLGPGIYPITVTIADCAGNTNSCVVNFVVVTPEQGCGPCSCPTNNLIVNGSFEDPPFNTGADCQQLLVGSTLMPGWTVSIDEIARCKSAPPYNVSASQGLLAVDLTGFTDSPPHGAVTQTVPTTVGQCYRLTFDLGVNLDWPGLLDGPITVKVTAGGATSQLFTHNPSGSGTVWNNYVFLFSALGPSTTITFEGVSGKNYIGLDNVELYCSCACTNCAVAIACPSNIVAYSCSATFVFYPTPTPTSSCGVTPTVTCVPPSGSAFPLGLTTVQCIANDGLGHLAACNFTVTVLPPPHEICWPLKAAFSGANIVLSWPDSATGFTLEEASELQGADTVWTTITNSPSHANDMYQVTLPSTKQKGFYHLKPPGL